MSKLPIVAAGKTGTSQVTSIPQSTVNRLKEHELAYFHRSHAWITTYAPYDDPQFVVTVLIEHGGHGGSASGPMAADIYKWLFAHGYFKKKPETEEIEKIKNELDKKIAENENLRPVAHGTSNASSNAPVRKKKKIKKKQEKKKVNHHPSVDLF